MSTRIYKRNAAIEAAANLLPDPFGYLADGLVGYTRDQMLAMRDAALEEALAILTDMRQYTRLEAMYAIRALKGTI